MGILKKILWLIAVVVFFLPSCKDSEEVNAGDDYYYYLDIQSEVRLNFKEEDEEQGTMTDSKYDLLSKTVYYMLQAVQENKSIHGDNRAKEAALITTCDSLYRNYSEKNPASKGHFICYVKLVRCHLRPNGTVKDALPIQYYNFWYEEPENEGNDASGNDSTANYYYSKPNALEAIDLGLSVLWASCNIGAKQPRDYGGLLAWGDPTGSLYSAQGIGWNDNGYTWNTDNYGGNNPPADISGSELDVVAKYWGDGWRIPTFGEAKELCEQCQWKLQNWGDIKWYEVIGPNGNSIIMPLAGIYGDDLGKPSNRFHIGPLYVNESGYY